AVPALNVYGGRMRAWVTPTNSGDYEFFLSSDADGEIRLSMEAGFDNIDDPNLMPIATDNVAGDGFQESGAPSTSLAITLDAGHSYPLQAIWKESNGPDYCKVAWRMVGDPTAAADLPTIPSEFLSYFGPVPSNTPRIQPVTLQNGKVVFDWTGNVLQSSPDLKTWTDIANAPKPYQTNPTGAGK